jgi:predicted nuclease with TOPRIM domain
MSQELSTLKKKNKALEKDFKKKSTEYDKLKEKSENTEKDLRKQNEVLKRELEKTRKSWSFKIGKAIAWLPGKIKRILKHK